MELRQLRSFVVVADELNVGRAAVRLHLTQPSLSRQIAALERDLGVELFARIKKRFVLTAAGTAFLHDARDLLQKADDAVLNAQRTQRGEVGTLRLRFVQSATFEALPRLLGAFRQAYSEVVLDLETMMTIRQTEALRDGGSTSGCCGSRRTNRGCGRRSSPRTRSSPRSRPATGSRSASGSA